MQRSKKSFLWAALAATAVCLAAPPAGAQINLTPGDVALVGWVDNGTPNDAFALVALADLPTGTTIYFTDNGWDGVSGGYRNTSGPNDGNGNETLMMLSVVSTIPAGRIIDTATADPAYTWTTSGAVPGAASGTFGFLVLTQTGDQVYAFQHDTGQNPLNTPTQMNLFALDDTGAFEDATTTGEGGIPSGLSVATNTALTFAQGSSSQSFMGFNTSAMVSGTKADWLAAIADPANWIFGSSGTLPSGSVTVLAGSPVTPFCFGDASASPACPCGNQGSTGHGCDNSASTGGAVLTASGSPAPDSIVLTSLGQLPLGSTFFLQGTQERTPIVFGDGLRCVGGTIRNLSSTRAIGGVAFYPRAGDPSITARSAALGDPIASGSMRFYQVMYRDRQATFCPSPAGNVWNVSSALRIAW